MTKKSKKRIEIMKHTWNVIKKKTQKNKKNKSKNKQKGGFFLLLGKAGEHLRSLIANRKKDLNELHKLRREYNELRKQQENLTKKNKDMKQQGGFFNINVEDPLKEEKKNLERKISAIKNKMKRNKKN